MNCGYLEIRIFAKTQAALDAVIARSHDRLRQECDWVYKNYKDRMWTVLPSRSGKSWKGDTQEWVPNGLTCHVATLKVFEQYDVLDLIEDVMAGVLDVNKADVFAFTRQCDSETLDPGGHFFECAFEASAFREFKGSNFQALHWWFTKGPLERTKRHILAEDPS